MSGGAEAAARPIPESWLAPDLVANVPVEWARRECVLPLRVEGEVRLAGTAATAASAYEDLALLTGVDGEWMEVEEGELRRAIDRTYFRQDTAGGGAAAEAREKEARAGAADGGAAAAVKGDDLLASAESTPVAQYVNRMLLEALKKGASDIHFEPYGSGTAVRYRIDGVLYPQAGPPKSLEAAVTARLKVMAKMDLAESRLPQDGAARVRAGEREIDLRVSSVPVAEGERVVLRILERESTRYRLGDLGMSEGVLERFRQLLRMPNGVVLVTGPTGSGKTTTLYAALGELDTAHLNVMTIEEPIEYELDGIGQIQVHPKIGLTFSSGLRHILRQDPDVILVGETRDLETAEIAIQASLTGHLVFTTLHTNDAPGAVVRLTDMGIPAYLLASSVRGVLAQRLVRKLCPHCRERAVLDPEDAARLGSPSLGGRPVWAAHAEGCPQCLGGYRGRIGVHELLLVTPGLAEAVRAGVSLAELRRLARASGFSDMLDDGAAKILAGETSAAEVLRAVGTREG